MCNVFVKSKSDQITIGELRLFFFSTYRIFLDLEGTLVTEFRDEVSSQTLTLNN